MEIDMKKELLMIESKTAPSKNSMIHQYPIGSKQKNNCLWMELNFKQLL